MAMPQAQRIPLPGLSQWPDEKWFTAASRSSKIGCGYFTLNKQYNTLFPGAQVLRTPIPTLQSTTIAPSLQVCLPNPRDSVACVKTYSPIFKQSLSLSHIFAGPSGLTLGFRSPRPAEDMRKDQ
jgi:hypothetical protein